MFLRADYVIIDTEVRKVQEILARSLKFLLSDVIYERIVELKDEEEKFWLMKYKHEAEVGRVFGEEEKWSFFELFGRWRVKVDDLLLSWSFVSELEGGKIKNWTSKK